ncbi:MAG TPA: hypothetical protein PK156_33540 [Polyangium sp.]|nr:hypothetical protein [Polyangium sp.]
MILEIQNECDPDKQRRWLLAAGVLLNQTGMMGDVIVVTSKKSVAKWAKTVANVETPLGTKLQLIPIVLHMSKDVIDLLLTDEQPELALVATWAIAHRDGPEARRVVGRTIELTNKLPKHLQATQFNAILSMLSVKMLEWVDRMKMNPNLFPLTELQERVKQKIMAMLEAQNRLKAEAKREALFVLLEARGLSVSDKERAAIKRCQDPQMLDAWIAKAATASSVQEVLATKLPKVKSRTTKPRTTKPRNTPSTRSAQRA